MKEKAKRLRKILEHLEKINLSRNKGLHDFDSNKYNYYSKEFDSLLNDFKKTAASSENNELISLIKKIFDDFDKKDFNSVAKSIDMISEMVPEKEEEVKVSGQTEFPELSIKIPSEIKQEIERDYEELKICFRAGAYRSVTILCGRMLETALFRKFYDVTGNDLLETSPGTGLGKIIAKLKEKNVDFDPGITEQIHLINQVRVHSVHKKSRLFNPTREQANAMVLYTADVLKKLF